MFILFDRIYIRLKISTPLIIGAAFVVASVLVFNKGSGGAATDFALGLVACSAVVLFAGKLSAQKTQPKILKIISENLMPIFLMHTLFAAPMRIMLLRIGINNAAVHILLGIFASFVGPIVAARIMKKSKWLEFFIYPGKFIRIQ